MSKLSLSKQVWGPVGILVVGLIVMVTGVAMATVWKPSGVVKSQFTSPQPVVVTRPGVLSLIDKTVTIRAESPDNGDVVIAVGRSADVIGWAAAQDWVEVTGVQESVALTFQKHNASGNTKDPNAVANGTAMSAPSSTDKTYANDSNSRRVSPLTSKMWLATAEGKGSAQLMWSNTDGQYSALIVSMKGNPKVSLHWVADARSPYAKPLIIIGVILVFLALVIGFILRIAAVRHNTRELRLRQESMKEDLATSTIVLGTDLVPSRRALREARERGETAIIIGDKEFSTGLIPIVKDANTRAVSIDAKSSEHENEHANDENVVAVTRDSASTNTCEDVSELIENEEAIGSVSHTDQEDSPGSDNGVETGVSGKDQKELAAQEDALAQAEIADSEVVEYEIADLSDWGAVAESSLGESYLNEDRRGVDDFNLESKQINSNDGREERQ